DVTPPPNMNAGLDLTYLPGLKLTANTNMVLANYPPAARFPAVYQGKGSTATGDGTIDLDLGQQYQVSQINLGFFSSNNWAGGGSVQIAATPGAWTTVDDSGRGHTFGPPATGGVKTVSFARQTVRFIRITDYFSAGVGTSAGRLDEIEVYN
ncbi:MAG TPA: discoidin domain-containing protein, partial [Polyangiaceae bacterium]